MLPGSKVIRITNWGTNNPRWEGVPIYKDEVHTVREIKTHDGLMLYFEDIYNPIISTGKFKGWEFGYDSLDFKEIDPLYNLFPDEKLANPEEHLILQPLELK